MSGCLSPHVISSYSFPFPNRINLRIISLVFPPRSILSRVWLLSCRLRVTAANFDSPPERSNGARNPPFTRPRGPRVHRGTTDRSHSAEQDFVFPLYWVNKLRGPFTLSSLGRGFKFRPSYWLPCLSLNIPDFTWEFLKLFVFRLPTSEQRPLLPRGPANLRISRCEEEPGDRGGGKEMHAWIMHEIPAPILTVTVAASQTARCGTLRNAAGADTSAPRDARHHTHPSARIQKHHTARRRNRSPEKDRVILRLVGAIRNAGLNIQQARKSTPYLFKGVNETKYAEGKRMNVPLTQAWRCRYFKAQSCVRNKVTGQKMVAHLD